MGLSVSPWSLWAMILPSADTRKQKGKALRRGLDGRDIGHDRFHVHVPGRHPLECGARTHRRRKGHHQFLVGGRDVGRGDHGRASLGSLLVPGARSGVVFGGEVEASEKTYFLSA